MKMIRTMMLLFLIMIISTTTASANIWVDDANNESGLGDIGRGTMPTIYDDGGTWKLITGDLYGDFHGFYWNGVAWTSDSGIVFGLFNLDSTTSPSVYNDSGTLNIIIGNDNGIFTGYQWDVTSWSSNSSIVNGLADVGFASAPTVFNDNGTWKLITGEEYGHFYGYYWNGSTWISDSSVISGLIDAGFKSAPNVFNDNGTLKLISGNDKGEFDGYYWNDTSWVTDLSIVYGLSIDDTNSAPAVYNDDGILKMINGRSDGSFNRWYLNTPPTIPTSFTDLNNNVIDHNPTISWTKGTDNELNTVNTYVYVGVTSTPTTLEGSTTNETLNLGVNTTLSDGSSYYYRLRSYDGYEWSNYTVADAFTMNTIPSITNITLTPVPTLDSDDLTAHNDTATDDDGDSITLQYYWYKDNVLQTALNNISTILASNLTTNEVWKVGIIPNDGYENGIEVQSSTTTIGLSNVAPTLSGITVDFATIKYNKTLTVSTLNASDINGDNYTFYVGSDSGLNDICASNLTINGNNPSCSFIINETSGNHILYGVLNDGNDTSTEYTIVYTVDTTPPTLNSSSINPTSFTNDESATISASVVVADGEVNWVKVKIIYDALTSTNHSMVLVNDTYKYIFSPSAAGNYEITTFYASDDSGNIMEQSVSIPFEVSTGSTGGSAGGGGLPSGDTNVTIAGDLKLTPDRRDTYFFYTALNGEQTAKYQFIANRNVEYCSIEPNSWATCEIVDGYIVEVTLKINETVSSYDGIITIGDENDYVVTSALVVRVVKIFGAIPIGNYEVGGFAEILNVIFETNGTALIGIRTWFIGIILAGFGFALYKVYSQ